MAGIQLLLSDEGNRQALASVVDEHYTSITDETIRDAELYLVDEPSFPRYRDALEQRKREMDPVFCPVVLIRRQQTPITIDLPDIGTAEPPLLVNDVVTAPVEKQALFRTISNLLARRHQTEELVTDLRDQNEELRKFKNAVENAGHAIFITDTDGTIEYVNSAFEELTGYTAAEAVGANPRILKSGEHDEAFYHSLWNTILSGEIWTSEIVNERKSGERFTINQTIAPIKDTDSEIQGFVGIQDDITGQRLREQQLTVFHRVLRHNLRNKGTVIEGHADILEQSLDDDGFCEHLRTIQESVQSLLDVSEKANRVQHLLADSLEKDVERELTAILEQITERVASSYPDAELSLENNVSNPLKIDARVTSAFQELVENAVKHSGTSSSRVTLTVTMDATTATVTIADNGPGIPDQERRVIEAGTEEPLEHGSGLGLWFAYWLISYVGGNIDIQANADGTTVSVGIPCDDPSS